MVGEVAVALELLDLTVQAQQGEQAEMAQHLLLQDHL